MVVSKLNKKINYPNLKSIFPDDRKKKSSIYEILINNIPINIVIGNKRAVETDSQILIFPIYLVKSNRKVIPIGLYEISRNEYLSHIDDIEDYLDSPLLYDFVDKNYLLENTSLTQESDDYVKETKHKKAIPISSLRKDIFTLSPSQMEDKHFPIESEVDARNIREKYKMRDSDLWIQKWMKNRKYDIKDNEGGGDCLFATIRDAFLSIGQETTINQLRKKVVQQVTEQMYFDYLEKYEMLSNQLKHTTDESLRYKKEVDKLKSKIGETISLDEKKKIRKLGNHIKEEYNSLKLENKLAKELIEDCKFMRNVKSFEDFKRIIQTCEFWADPMTISILEKTLGIKFIIFSSEKYRHNDFSSVLQCSNIIDPAIEEREMFIPDFYVIIEHTGNLYKLIGYRGKYLFSFSEIPYDVKRIVVDKCLQQEGALFNYIPDFKSFQTGLLRGGTSMKLNEFEDLNESTLNKLYDHNIVLGIDISSMDNVAPGKGRGEKMEPENRIFDFVRLTECPFWRKVLAREFDSEFDLDGYKWDSVEHYYQANKFAHHPDYYKSFSRKENQPKIDILMVKAMGGKDGKLKGKLVRDSNIKIDPEFYGSKQKHILRKATKAKYLQNPELFKILLNTNDAKLMRLKKGNPPELLDDLMVVRSELK